MTDPDVARAVAINVAANTTLPGVRGPIYPDGSFLYVPIPEREPTVERVPTYAALGFDDDLPTGLPDEAVDRRVHFDPEFAGYYGHERYTYGDEHGVKAGPLSRLEPGDSLVFYATLRTESFRDTPARTTAGTTADPGDPVGWRPPDWGAYAIGAFRVARVVTPEDDRDPPAWAASNAHCRRETFDAEVLVRGTDDSRLFERAVPLSDPAGGASANVLVTELSNDSGRGPWWRRVLRFDADETARLRRAFETAPDDWLDDLAALHE